jgi:surfeit locus 1 family protein
MPSRSRLWLILGFTIVAVVCARLGFWQVHRLRERRAANRVALAERSKAPVTLEQNDTAGAAFTGRRVRAVGHYDTTHEIVLRGRVYQGVPGVEIVSPLVLGSGRTAVLVNRGFVPAPDAVTVSTDSLRELGRVRVEGIAFPIPSGRGAPVRNNSETTWAELDLEQLRSRLPYPISPIYIRQSPDSTLPRFPRRLDPLPLDDGPHLSYAIQWFAFSVMAVVFGIILGKKKREENNVSGGKTA